MPKFEITNMVMVQNPKTGEVVAQERVKYWCGVVFPGGHPEKGESIYDSAIREIKEETGLEIRNLKSCGFMYWDNNKTGDKYFCYFFKTTDYSGKLIEKTDEGIVFWTSLEELKKMPHPTNFNEYLPSVTGLEPDTVSLAAFYIAACTHFCKALALRQISCFTE